MTVGRVLPFETREQRDARRQQETELQRARRVFAAASPKIQQAANTLAQRHSLSVQSTAISTAEKLLHERFGWTEAQALRFAEELAAALGLQIRGAERPGPASIESPDGA